MLWNSLTPVWRACVGQAWEAMGANTFPIGAIVVDGSGDVVAAGRNRVFETEPHPGALHGSMLAHAEMNALVDLANMGKQARECELYTSLDPCPMCLGAIRMSSIRRVHIAARDPLVEAALLATSTGFMRRRQIELLGPENLILERVLVVMHTIFTLNLGSAWDVLVEEKADLGYMVAVNLGRELVRSGEWREYTDAGLAAADAVDKLAARVADV